MKTGSYLVCGEYLESVCDFLKTFLPQIENEYSHKEWITFLLPNSDSLVNLMKGDDQAIT